MTDADLDALLAHAAKTTAGAVRVAHLAADLQKIAGGIANETTRPAAEQLLKDWAGGEDGLRKAIASHWLERAQATVAGAQAQPQGTKSAAPAAHANKRPVHPGLARLRNLARQRQGAAA